MTSLAIMNLTGPIIFNLSCCVFFLQTNAHIEEGEAEQPNASARWMLFLTCHGLANLLLLGPLQDSRIFRVKNNWKKLFIFGVLISKCIN